MQPNDADSVPLTEDDMPSIEPGWTQQLSTVGAQPRTRRLARPAVPDRPTFDDEATAPIDADSLAALLRNDARDGSATLAAEQEWDIRPTPPAVVPKNKWRTRRSILTIVISAITVLALVAVGIVFAVQSQAATAEEEAFETYSAQQALVAQAATELTSTYSAITTEKADAETVNLAAAAALAAVAGVSDETVRAAAETQRVATETATSEVIVVDPADTPYKAPGVSASSSLSVINGALEEIATEATRIEAAQVELDAALTAITDARTAFTTAFTTFTDTITATATALVDANPDAGQEWRDAVTTAVTALGVATRKGAGAVELQAYAAAALALQDENARVVAEQEALDAEETTPRRTPQRPRGGTSPDRETTPPPVSSPAPEQPDEPGTPEEPTDPLPIPVPEPEVP